MPLRQLVALPKRISAWRAIHMEGDTTRLPRAKRGDIMRRLLVGGLGLSLVWWIASARRGDAQSPAFSPPAAVAELKPAPYSLRFPGVMLGRPVALPDEPAVANHRPAILDQQLRPVAYSMERANRIGPVVWTQSSDVAQPLPLGPVSGTDTPLPAKPQTPATETPEKLGTPRLIPMPNVSNKLNAVAIPDECDGPNSGSCGACDCSGSCGDGCCLPRCLFPLC